MPSRTCTFAIPNAATIIRLARGGRAARIAGLRVIAYNAAVAVYVVIAYICQLTPSAQQQFSTNTHETTVVKLDCGRVLEDVPPPQVRTVGCLCVCL